jgi:hypothetical protein
MEVKENAIPFSAAVGLLVRLNYPHLSEQASRRKYQLQLRSLYLSMAMACHPMKASS